MLVLQSLAGFVPRALRLAVESRAVHGGANRRAQVLSLEPRPSDADDTLFLSAPRHRHGSERGVSARRKHRLRRQDASAVSDAYSVLVARRTTLRLWLRFDSSNTESNEVECSDAELPGQIVEPNLRTPAGSLQTLNRRTSSRRQRAGGARRGEGCDVRAQNGTRCGAGERTPGEKGGAFPRLQWRCVATMQASQPGYALWHSEAPSVPAARYESRDTLSRQAARNGARAAGAGGQAAIPVLAYDRFKR